MRINVARPIPGHPLCHWLNKHGGSDLDAAVPGWVEVDDVARQIRYLTWDKTGPIVDDSVRTYVTVIQLESAALALPDLTHPDIEVDS